MYAALPALVLALSLLTPGTLVHGQDSVMTPVGVLPSHLETHLKPTDLTKLLLRYPETEDMAARQVRRLNHAMLKYKDNTVRNLFVAWSKAHNKYYATTTEATSALHVFTQSLDILISRNQTDYKDLVASPEAFIDISQSVAQYEAQQAAAQQARNGSRGGAHKSPRLGFARLRFSRRLKDDPVPVLKSNYPSSYNHKTLGNLSPVVNQGLSCGSCWANSAVGAINAAVAIYLKSQGYSNFKVQQYSRQAVVDCANQNFAGDFYVNDNGCNLGCAADALYFAGSYAIPLESAYPYTSALTSRAGDCKSDQVMQFRNNPNGIWLQLQGVLHYATTDDWGTPIAIAEEDLMAAVFNQPIVIYWSVAVNWLSWEDTSGIYTVDDQNDLESGCWNDAGSVDHAMLLVGYSQTENSWTVMNSWGPDWCEDGFFRTEMTHDESGPCGMYWYAVAPTVAFKRLPPQGASNPPPPTYPPSPPSPPPQPPLPPYPPPHR